MFAYNMRYSFYFLFFRKRTWRMTSKFSTGSYVKMKKQKYVKKKMIDKYKYIERFLYDEEKMMMMKKQRYREEDGGAEEKCMEDNREEVEEEERRKIDHTMQY